MIMLVMPQCGDIGKPHCIHYGSFPYGAALHGVTPGTCRMDKELYILFTVYPNEMCSRASQQSCTEVVLLSKKGMDSRYCAMQDGEDSNLPVA